MTYTASLENNQRGASLRANAPIYSKNVVRIGAGQLCPCPSTQTICDYEAIVPIDPITGLALVSIKFTSPTGVASEFMFNGGSAVIIPASGNAAIIAQIKATYIDFLNSYLLDASGANVVADAFGNLVFTAQSALLLLSVSTLVSGVPTSVPYTQNCLANTNTPISAFTAGKINFTSFAVATLVVADGSSTSVSGATITGRVWTSGAVSGNAIIVSTTPSGALNVNCTLVLNPVPVGNGQCFLQCVTTYSTGQTTTTKILVIATSAAGAFTVVTIIGNAATMPSLTAKQVVATATVLGGFNPATYTTTKRGFDFANDTVYELQITSSTSLVPYSTAGANKGRVTTIDGSLIPTFANNAFGEFIVHI